MKPEKISEMIKQLNVTPSAELDIKIHDAFEKALVQSKSITSTAQQSNRWRIIMNSRITKLAVAAAIIVAALLVLNFIGGPGMTSVAWAEAVKPFLSAKTLIVDIVVGDEESSPVMHDIIVDSRIRRTISNIPGTVMVIDTEGGKMLALDENGKGAMYIDIEGPLGQGTEHFVRAIRELITKVQSTPDFEVEQLEEKEIDGIKTVGLSAGGAQDHITIWADSEKKIPVRIEIKAGNTPFILKNFKFDVPVDESLVSMEVPAGFTTQEEQQQPDFSDASEEDFVKGLRIYAEVIGEGLFPAKVDTGYMMQQMGPLQEKVSVLDCPDEQKGRICMEFAKGFLFIQFFDVKGMGPWHYAGDGVELGDAETAIFWYQPAGSQTWRVIYGDLSIKDVAEADLPK